MADDSKDPYDFIMHPDKPTKNPVKLDVGNSMLARFIIVGIGLIILIIAIVIGLSSLNKSSNAQNQKLIGIAQSQKEILRIAQATNGKIAGAELNSVIANVEISTQSSFSDINSALAKRGKKVKDKELTLGQNPKNDEILTQAEQNSQFDTAYKALLAKQLNDYQIQLEAAHGSANDNEKAILANAYDQAKLITEQLKAIQ